ncbi:MAG: DNA double-strand break repair nuclease NurA, partial [Ktedonobacterales bacterium]
QDRYGHLLSAYRDALRSLGARFPSAAALTAAQDAALPRENGPRSVGARATAEYDTWRGGSDTSIPVLPFGRTFAHHEAARAWAECLRGITTLAVDGSQLPPWRDASVPIALVQAGLFENPHSASEPYIKDAFVELLAPDDLIVAEPDTSDVRTGEFLSYSKEIVNLRRFELEVSVLAQRMEHHARGGAGQRGSQAPRVVAFYDGSLITSFALKLAPQIRDRYVQGARRLLETSRDTGIPLVGYIDTSYARDIVTLLAGLDESRALSESRGVHDALLWNGSLRWGDRSPAFLSARNDLNQMGYGEQRSEIAFVYFQATSDRPPARIEFPRWILDAGQLDEVLTVVRAETIAGNGYPYPIETADAVAVISAHDRAQFYAAFQEFADRNGLAFGFSRKALSKSRRRV